MKQNRNLYIENNSCWKKTLYCFCLETIDAKNWNDKNQTLEKELKTNENLTVKRNYSNLNPLTATLIQTLTITTNKVLVRFWK